MLRNILSAIAVICLLSPMAQADEFEEARKKFEAAKGAERKEAAKPYLDELIVVAEAQVLAGKPKEAIALYRKGLPVAVFAKHRLDEMREGVAWAGKVMAAKGDEAKLAKLRSEPPSEKFARHKTITLSLGNGVTMRLIRILPGSYVAGTPAKEPGRMADDPKTREVKIAEPFYIGETEVTQQQYKAVMGKNPSRLKGPNHPVETVTAQEALEFCRKLAAATQQQVILPTEDQWEYACRAGTKTRYSCASEERLGIYAWHKENSDGKPQPVAQKQSNAWGLYDMHGNVWERCAPDGTIVRGGSCREPPRLCASARRSTFSAHLAGPYVGFRAVVTKRSAEAGQPQR